MENLANWTPHEVLKRQSRVRKAIRNVKKIKYWKFTFKGHILMDKLTEMESVLEEIYKWSIHRQRLGYFDEDFDNLSERNRNV